MSSEGPGHDPSSDRESADAPDGAAFGKQSWLLMGFAALLGVFGAISGLVFIGVTEVGEDWYGAPGLGWFDGHAWWILVAAAAGLIVGAIRRWLHMPDQIPGLIEDLQVEHIETRWVPSIVAVSAVSLIGGASLGPEVALGQMGGGAGGWIARRRSLDDGVTKSMTLSGMAAGFGGLFSSPLLTMVLVLEVAKPPVSRYLRTFYGTLISSSVSFGVFFALAGTVFLGIYQVPSYSYEDWHLVAGLALGIAAALLVVVMGAILTALKKAVDRLPTPPIVRPVLGGVAFGLIGFALPLTNFTGSGQLDTVLTNAETLGIGLLVAILIGKMLAFGISSASGFIGGPIFPILFIGGTAGTIAAEAFPVLPIGLAFACMLAAVPGSIVPAPFSMVLLAALVTQIGTLETAPVLVAVGAAYLTVSALRTVRARRARASDRTV
jgi:H+/Cl- antiporter ClcA